MNKRVIVVGLIAALTAANCSSAAEIRLGGGGASIATVFIPIKPAFEKATGHNLIILQSTPKDGIRQLWNGKLDAAVIAGDVNDMIAEVEKDKVKIDKAALWAAEIGANKTVVIVHPSNMISSLTKDQMKGLFTGKISNWKDIGGSDEPVLVVWGKNSPSQNALFTKLILDGEKVRAEHLDTDNYKDIKDSVASNNGAVGIDPLGMVDETVKSIKPSPEASTPIFLVTKGIPLPPVKQLLDFLKNQGKKYIKD